MPRSLSRRLAAVLPSCLVLLALLPATALAQIDVTPNFSITPSRDEGGWTYWMAKGAIALGILILLALVAAYLRFAPRFFGREEPTKLPPGVRPPLLARRPATARQQAMRQPQALASSVEPPSAPPSEPPVRRAPEPVAGVAATSTGTAVAELADRPPVPASGEVPPEETERSTTPGRMSAATNVSQEDSVAERRAAEPGAAAVAAPPEAAAAVTAAPDTGETAQAAPDTGETAQAAPAAAQPAPDTREAADATPDDRGAAARGPRPAGGPEQQADSPVPEVSHSGGAALDQETFDRVLQEQLAKGMDRRVAEGRARAAAVVAARKKAQG